MGDLLSVVVILFGLATAVFVLLTADPKTSRKLTIISGVLALVGGLVFWATAWLFETIQDRLSTGPVAKAAPALSVLGLYLAAQCFSGMII